LNSTATAPVVVHKKPTFKQTLAVIWRNRWIYVLIAPAIAYFIIFSYVPMYGIQLAWKKFMYNKGIIGSPWVGWKNFDSLWVDKEFLQAVKNTLIISFGKLLTGFPAPIILALFLNEIRNQKFKKVVQSVLYLPHFLSWVIIAGLLHNMFSVTNGAVTRLFASFGVTLPRLLGNPETFRPMLYITNIWKGVGWGTIIYLAAIAGINPELYESALIDGAGRFKQMWYITLPSLAYAITIQLILALGHIMSAGFDQIFNMYDPGVYSVGDIIDTFTYRVGLQAARYEYSTAVSLFQNVINCVLLLTTNTIVKRMGYGGIY